MISFLRRVWVFVRPYRGRLLLGLVCGFLFAISNALLMLVVKYVPNVVFAPEGQNMARELISGAPAWIRSSLESWFPSIYAPSSRLGILLIISTLPLVMLLRGLFHYLNVYLTTWASTRAVADVRLKLFDHLQNLPLSFFDRARTGHLISRIVNDTAQLHQTIANSLSVMVKDPITILALVVLLLSQQPVLTLISLVVFPICVLPVVIYGRKIRKSAKELQTHMADMSDVMHEAFTGNRIVKAYGLENTLRDRFAEHLRRTVSRAMRILRAQETPGPVIEFFGSLGVAFVFIYVVTLSTDERPTPGDLIQFIGSIFMMYQPMKALGRLQNQLEQARAASSNVFELLETRSDIVDPPSPRPLKAAGADIHFENVDFNYGEKPVLRNIHFKVKAGTMVALVGASGSGKTTLTNLLLRFYDPQQGSVRIGDTDVREAAVADLRRQIALVAQENLLFNETIGRNIALGRPTATPADVQAAAQHAFAHEFILQKPQGYDTLAGEKGVSLSGGQRQRIAIARAILKDAPILVLDEATNALDAESERAVQQALDELMRGRTTICIAHRLSTIQRADQIIVLDAGRIVETGTHDSLLAKNGVYARLCALQFQSPAEVRQA